MTMYGMAGRAAVSLLGLNPQEIINAGAEYLKTRETERTKREWIRANHDAFLAALQAEQETLLAYFEYKFAERREALDEFYQTLRQGVESGDSRLLDASICGILGIVKDNPLNDFETFRQVFNTPGATIVI